MEIFCYVVMCVAGVTQQGIASVRRRHCRWRGRHGGGMVAGRWRPRPGRRLPLHRDPARQISRRLRTSCAINSATRRQAANAWSCRRLFRWHHWRWSAAHLTFYIAKIPYLPSLRKRSPDGATSYSSRLISYILMILLSNVFLIINLLTLPQLIFKQYWGVRPQFLEVGPCTPNFFQTVKTVQIGQLFGHFFVLHLL